MLFSISDVCNFRAVLHADEGVIAAWSSIIQGTTVINATGDDLTAAAEAGYKSLKVKEDLEKNFPTIEDGTPSYRHQQVMKSGPESIRIARNAYVENIATEKLRSDAPGRFLNYLLAALPCETRNISLKFWRISRSY